VEGGNIKNIFKWKEEILRIFLSGRRKIKNIFKWMEEKLRTFLSGRRTN
jgi:hypothetical protein